ncbi:H-NS-like global regulator TsrA [Vibrio vulnificus]|uniref:H-NS-like global regulator TsrA n=1 Tax=Vibrio vulnificus TaxID=672 RepID=UPI003D9CBC96
MSLPTYEMARILEQMEESPEKIMFGKLLVELGNQSEERIRSAAKQVPLHVLRDIVYQFQQVINSRKGEQVESMAKELAEQGISADELLAYLQNK